MSHTIRRTFPYLATTILAAALCWAVSFGTLPQADFTFVNGTEIQSIDPAIVTGQPEGRIVMALFEGLTRWNEKDLHPEPGVAESWDISEDGLVYTFHLRADARWSDGSPVTADDFYFSFRRFLDPLSAGEYAYQLWYVKNAARYTRGTAALQPGDPVEVELHPPSGSSPPFARGPLVYGTLLRLETADGQPYEPAQGDQDDAPLHDGAQPQQSPLCVVDLDGRIQRYWPGAQADQVASSADYTPCRQVLFDFRQVGVRVLDSRTLELTLEHSTPYFLQLTGFYPLFPVNRRCVEQHGFPAWTRPENIVTNGPFRLEFRRIRDRIRLLKSDTYWNRDRVALNIVDALAVESDTTGLNLYMTGKADWITTVPTTAIPELLRQQRPDFQPTPELTVYYYRLNTTRPPLGDVRVRRALAMALDKQEVVQRVTQAGDLPARSFVPPGLPGYQQADGPEYDPEAARKLLAEAGYPGGQGFPTIEIMFNAVEAHATIAQLIQAQWQRNLGISVRLRQQEWNAYLVDQRNLKYWVARAGWIGDYSDPNTFLDMFVTGGGNNQTGWSNARYDQLIAAAAGESQSDRRLAMLHEAETILMAELPIVPVYFRVSRNMVRPYVRGFYHNIQDVHPLEAISIDQQLKQQFMAEEEWR